MKSHPNTLLFYWNISAITSDSKESLLSFDWLWLYHSHSSDVFPSRPFTIFVAFLLMLSHIFMPFLHYSYTALYIILILHAVLEMRSHQQRAKCDSRFPWPTSSAVLHAFLHKFHTVPECPSVSRSLCKVSLLSTELRQK